MSAHTHEDARQTSPSGLDRAANRYSPSFQRARAVGVRSRKPERISGFRRPTFISKRRLSTLGFATL